MGSLMDIEIEAGNLTYAKRYEESIKLLDKYFYTVKDRETLAQFHIKYAVNYDKLKEVEKCNYHCEEAIKLKHYGTYSYERLIKNYVKAKDWENALRVIDIIFKNEKVFDHRKFFEEKPSQWEDISSYALKRKEFILKKMTR